MGMPIRQPSEERDEVTCGQAAEKADATPQRAEADSGRRLATDVNEGRQSARRHAAWSGQTTRGIIGTVVALRDAVSGDSRSRRNTQGEVGQRADADCIQLTNEKGDDGLLPAHIVAQISAKENERRPVSYLVSRRRALKKRRFPMASCDGVRTRTRTVQLQSQSRQSSLAIPPAVQEYRNSHFFGSRIRRSYEMLTSPS